MGIGTFFYSIGQGFKNLTRNGLFTLASIATISSCLFLFGIFYSIITNFQYNVKKAEEGVSVTVFFHEGTTNDQMLALKTDVENRTEVRKVEFESAEEAWEKFKAEYLQEYADGWRENPLEGDSNLQIYLNDVSRQPALVAYLESVDIVRVVNRSEITASTLTAANNLIALVSMGIIIILLAVSVFLISNTVTIGISVRKDEINIMKYIGATDFFVRAPFVIEGMIIGLIGAVIPLILVYFIYNYAVGYVENSYLLLNSFLDFLPVKEVFRTLTVITLIVGVGIGFIGSFVTVRRHLHV